MRHLRGSAWVARLAGTAERPDRNGAAGDAQWARSAGANGVELDGLVDPLDDVAATRIERPRRAVGKRDDARGNDDLAGRAHAHGAERERHVDPEEVGADRRGLS